MKLLQVSCFIVLVWITASQPRTLVFKQAVNATDGVANQTLGGPIFIGNNSGNGIVTSYGSNFSFWRKNSADLYAMAESWVNSAAPSWILAAERLPGNKFVAQGTGLNTSALYRLSSSNSFNQSQETLSSPGQPVTVKSVAFSSNGTKFLAGNQDGTISVWSRDPSNDTFMLLGKLYGHSSAVIDIAVSSNNDQAMVSLSEAGEIVEWSSDLSAEGGYTLKFGFEVNGAAKISLCQSVLLVGLKSGHIQQYQRLTDLKSFEYVGDVSSNYTTQVKDLKFSESCNQFLSAAEGLIYWQQGSDGQYSPALKISNFTPSSVAIAPTEVAVAVDGTGVYNIYTISLNCAELLNTNGTDGIDACLCVADYVWNGSECYQIDCSQYNYTTTRNSTVSCNCIDNYYWDANHSACVVNCQAISNTTNDSDSLVSCNCTSGYTWIESACQPNCSDADNTLTVSLVKGTCACSVGYFWNATALQCWRNCSQIINSYSGANVNSTICKCLPNFTWNISLCSPIPINCTEVPDAIGHLDNYTCNCPSSFFYSNSQCIINCLGIPFITNATAPTTNSCVCTTGYVWKPTEFLCRIDCSLLANTTNNSLTAIDVCNCITNFKWMNGSCVIDCAIANASSLNYSNWECGCNIGWYWNNSFCQLDCGRIPKTTGIVNISVCSCMSGYIWLGGQCILDCSNISNADTAINGNITDCICLSGYSWDGVGCYLILNCTNDKNAIGFDSATNASCICKTDFAWINGSCLYNCLNVSNSKGTNNGIYSCNCQQGYIWDGISRCLLLPICAGMIGSIGKVSPFDPFSCLCTDYYSWDGKSCQIRCGAIANTDATISVSVCNCTTDYVWNSVTLSCDLNCSGILNAVSLISVGVCNCTSGYFWVGSSCWINCSLNNSIGTASTTTCTCTTGYYWDTTANVCVLNCSTIFGATSRNGNTDCRCQNSYSWLNGSCWINCNQVVGSNTSNNGVSACDCKTGYYWDGGLGLCLLNCTGIKNSNETNLDPYVCNCNSGFYWNNTSGGCYLNCSHIVNTTSSVNATSCRCSTSNVWNIANSKCVYVPPSGNTPIQCSDYSNTTGNNGSDACLCISGFDWRTNSTPVGCYRTCTDIDKSKGNADKATCICEAGYHWDASSNTCILNPINCSTYSQTDGNDGSSGCKCNSGYYWNSSALDCYRDCSTVSNATTFNPDRPQECACKLGWLYSGNICVFSCSNVHYNASNSNPFGEVCTCRSGYRWDSITYQCLSSSSNSQLAVGLGVGLGVPLGILGLVGIVWLFSMGPAAAPVVSQSVTQASLQGALQTTKIITTGGTLPPTSQVYIGPPVSSIFQPSANSSQLMAPKVAGIPSQIRHPITLSHISQQPAEVESSGISPINIGRQLASETSNIKVIKPPPEFGSRLF